MRNQRRIALAAEHDFVFSEELSIYFVGRSEDHRRPRVPDPNALKYVQGAAGVDFEILDRAIETGGDRDLSGKMQHRPRLAHTTPDRLEVADVRDFDCDAPGMPAFEPFRIFLCASPRQVVEHQDGLAALRQRVGEVAAEETAAPRYQHRRVPQSRLDGAHATSPRLSSSAVARSMPSSAT